MCVNFRKNMKTLYSFQSQFVDYLRAVCWYIHVIEMILYIGLYKQNQIQ